jgi:hypothetical protein
MLFKHVFVIFHLEDFALFISMIPCFDSASFRRYNEMKPIFNAAALKLFQNKRS